MKNESKSENIYSASELFTTVEFAAALKQSPRTIYKNHSLQGHHLGARPIRLSNSRLRWKAEDARKILNGEVLS